MVTQEIHDIHSAALGLALDLIHKQVGHQNPLLTTLELANFFGYTPQALANLKNRKNFPLTPISYSKSAGGNLYSALHLAQLLIHQKPSTEEKKKHNVETKPPVSKGKPHKPSNPFRRHIEGATQAILKAQADLEFFTLLAQILDNQTH